ncbi:GPW/gp25 family protein [Ideonella sp. 4Y16]|uniref:GPW/gp25 family protein n=1 Tax=Ideonella alba TaxID=2824118 RepID=UPI001B362EEE|nr:GPW/gp25 family protein [Ideonella alba]MBQ0946125.1 GPW/gp25 family protein [Ideonella alba]
MSTPGDDDLAFLGRGWSFPPAFGAGGVQMREGEDDIHEALRILFGTVAGERFLRPGWGLSLRPMLFEPLDTTRRTELAEQIKVQLLVHEPRIELLALDVRETEPGRLQVQLDYRVRSTNSRFNLVYPFYDLDASEHRPVLGPVERG